MVLLLGDENISAPAVHVSGILLDPLTYSECVFVLSLDLGPGLVGVRFPSLRI